MKTPFFLIFHKDHPLDVLGPNSGAETATLALARTFAKRGHKVVVAGCLKQGSLERDGVQYWDLGENFDVGLGLKKAETLGGYYLISAGRALPLLQSRAESACLKRFLICHDPSGSATGIQAAILSRVADRVICVSEAQKKLFVDEGADSSRVTVIYNGVDTAIFYPGDNSKRDLKRIVFSGALVPHKGIHVLMNSFCKLLSRSPQLKLDVYGSAALWGKEPMFSEAEVSAQIPAIRFHGSVGQEVLGEAFRNAGLCVISSIAFDSFPLTSIEAQACGCPVMAFDVGGIREGIVDGKTGVLVRELSEQALTNSLQQLLENPQRMLEMAAQAPKRTEEIFNWNTVCEKIEMLCGIEKAEKSIQEDKSSAEKNGESALLLLQ